MLIKTSDREAIKKVLGRIVLPEPESHKGHNGKLLIIGGSTLFHAASLWAAEVASHFVDMVHYSSTVENEKIFHELKKVFRNGIIVPQASIDDYAVQDDAVLIGPGMMREGPDGAYAKKLTERLIGKFPEKRFVFDAGALQMMEKEWLFRLKQKPIITPHQKEFETLFGIPVMDKNEEDKSKIVKDAARKFNAVILFKAIRDYVTDGKTSYVISGGNAGLTKGGTGDVLAGLTAALVTKTDPLISAAASSILLKKSAEELYRLSGYWYNVTDIINKLPEVLARELPVKI
ncbi:MAG: NAD(P)H-hydrate dehydratase [Patescibacteria group bacterium]